MNLQDARVLIVDDEPELLEIFSAWLECLGCRTITAANGVEALKVLRDRCVDVLISDIRMPIMDGMTMLRRMLEQQLTVPSIILVSGFGHIERREMHALGVEKLLEKPLRRQHLLQALESSMTDRAELWSRPMAGRMEQTLSLEVRRFGSDACGIGMQLGRGGCCVASDKPLVEDKSIEFSIRSSEGETRLEGQGEVEWFDPACGCAGISFAYLEADARAWAIRMIDRMKPLSFIPMCDASGRAPGESLPAEMPGVPGRGERMGYGRSH